MTANPAAAGRGFWSSQRIRERHAERAIFGSADERGRFVGATLDRERLKAASYELVMGEEYYVSPASREHTQTVTRLGEGEAFVIPPGQFAFLLTDELVRVPEDALGFIALRSMELKFRGLVNVSGFHVDPGYCGRLVFAVYNAGPADVHLRRGMPLFEIFLCDLDQPTDRPYSKPGLLRIETRLIGSIAGEFDTFAGMKAKIDEVESDLDGRIQTLERGYGIVRWSTAILLGALVTFAVRECTPVHIRQAAPIEAQGEAR
jgi:dCTP deaminase